MVLLMAYKTPPFTLMTYVTFNCAQFTKLSGNLFPLIQYFKEMLDSGIFIRDFGTKLEEIQLKDSGNGAKIML